MVDAQPGSKFDVSLDLGAGMTGLVGTLAVRIVDPGVQETPLPRTTAGITEFPAGSGVYGVTLTAPLAPGLYVIVWDTAGAGPLTSSNSWGEPLTVVIENPTFPGGWSWSPYGWLNTADDNDQWALSGGSPGSNPVPDAAAVRAASKLDWCELGYGQDGGPGGLQEVVDQAESLFWRVTGQTIDRINPKDAPLVRRVITGLTQQMAMQNSVDYMETLSDFDLISSFSAGPYNETRRSPGEMFQARMLNSIPWISDALWNLLSYERYGYWISFFSGVNMPAWTTTDVFWEAGQIAGELGGPPGAGFWWGA